MEATPKVWHPEVIDVAAQAAAGALARASVLNGFYLAGGTGLALQLGHRRSHDLDFFNFEAFSEQNLLEHIRQAGELTVSAVAPHTLHVVMQGVKVSFLAYGYPLLFPRDQFLSMNVADYRDIACMKLSAVASRGTKRDFVDLHAAANRISLPELLTLFERKFAGSRYNPIHLQKSLTYFSDAEQDPMPDMLSAASWEDIKQFFVKQARSLF